MVNLFGRVLCVYCGRFAWGHLMCPKHRAILTVVDYKPQLNFETTTYTIEHSEDEEKDRSLKP